MFSNALQQLNWYILIEAGLVNIADFFVDVKTFLSGVYIDKGLPPSPFFCWGKKVEEDILLKAVAGECQGR